ncbi:putative retrotransposon gag domain-containing protein [Helianthus annuus]|nr:putative retrotransposon gag domain-containing protein [Helianthus annuus]
MSSSRSRATQAARRKLADKCLAAMVAKKMAKVVPQVVSELYGNMSKSSEESRTDSPKSGFSFKQFKACGPKEFTGEEGPTALFQWFDSIEVTLRQSGCPDTLRTLNVTGVFQSRALDWWTTKRNKRRNDVAYGLSWDKLKNVMLEEFSPPHERQRLEDEFLHIKQKDGDNAALTARFKQLSIICPDQVKTTDMTIKKYIRALPDCVADFVHASKPATIEETYLLAAEINDKRVKASFWDKASKNLHQATTAASVETVAAAPQSSKSSRHKRKNNNNNSSNKNCAVTTAAPLQPVLAQQQQHRSAPTPITQAPPAKRAYTGPTQSAQHVLIITRWVLPADSACIATCTATSPLTAVQVLDKHQFKPLLFKLCFQLRKANKRLRHPRSTPESAFRVVIPTTSQTCARTGL